MSKNSLLIKIIGVIFILFIPLVITVGIFTPLASHQKKGKSVTYTMPRNFTKDDFRKLVQSMRRDQEFVFYFYALPKESVNAAMEDVYPVIDKNRDQAQYLGLLHETQEQVESLAIVSQSFNYNDDFFQAPQKYPDLSRALWLFFYEEFKLTLMGLSYKAEYDPSFAFKWNEQTKISAVNTKRMVKYLQDNHAWPPKTEAADVVEPH